MRTAKKKTRKRRPREVVVKPPVEVVSEVDEAREKKLEINRQIEQNVKNAMRRREQLQQLKGV